MSRKSSEAESGERNVPGVALLYKAFKVIDAVAGASSPLRIGPLLETTSLSKGTLYRLLQALIERGYLRYEMADQTYRLGTKVFDLAHSVWEKFDLRSAAAPELLRLRDVLGETVRLSVLDGTKVLYVDQLDAKSELRVSSAVGSRKDIHVSSAGKAMVCALEPVHKADVVSHLSFERYTNKTITDAAEFEKSLNLAAARGYAFSVEERLAGVSSMSAAILDLDSRPIGALTVVGPSFRLDEAKRHTIGRDLIDAARRIAGNAGMYTEPFSVSTKSRPSASISRDVHCVFESTALQGEGPSWNSEQKRLYWVDVLGPSLHILDPERALNRSLPMPHMISTALQTDGSKLVAITQKGVQLLDLRTNRLTEIVHPEHDVPSNRLNDAKVDSKGRIWVGSMAIDASPGRGSLYRISPNGESTVMDSGFTVSNGPAWSPDNTVLYFVDTGANRIYSYEFDESDGSLGKRSVFIEVPKEEGRPGGLTVDADGCLWMAHFDGWKVVRYTPTGRIDRNYQIPVPRPTSCAFGGENMSQLFVTTARIRLSAQRLAEAPLSGSVFCIETGITGLPANAFVTSKLPKTPAIK